MEFVECVKTRRSIRDFLSDEVSDEVIKEIIDIASYVPSWKNTQIVQYKVIKSKELKNTVAEKGTFGFKWNESIIRRAPMLVVLTYRKGMCGYDKNGVFATPKGDRWQMFDAGIAAQTFCLAAWEKGVGSVIMGIFDDEVIGSILEIPKEEAVAALIAIGYPAEKPDTPPKRRVEHLLKLM